MAESLTHREVRDVGSLHLNTIATQKLPGFERDLVLDSFRQLLQALVEASGRDGLHGRRASNLCDQSVDVVRLRQCLYDIRDGDHDDGRHPRRRRLWGSACELGL